MTTLSSVAETYLNVNQDEQRFLMGYYNDFVLPLIPKNRKYQMKKGDDWCAMFTSVCAKIAGFNYDSFPYEVSCYYQVERAKKLNAFHTDHKQAKVNDLILYDWVSTQGKYNHVGIIKEITNDEFHVIEGNYKGTVGIRKVKKTSNAISGFIKIPLS